MEIIAINQDKIKIILTPEDRRRYRLSESLIDENESARHAIQKLIADAAEHSDFSPQPGRTLLQLYESKDGGCEIFVTRLPACALDEANDSTEEIDSWDIFRFDSTDEIVRVCDLLRRNQFAGRCAVILYDRQYYLILPKDDHPLWLFDFGIPIDGAAAGYLHEYGRSLPYIDVIGTLASLHAVN